MLLFIKNSNSNFWVWMQSNHSNESYHSSFFPVVKFVVLYKVFLTLLNEWNPEAWLFEWNILSSALLLRWSLTRTRGCPSSKYEHWRASALLRHIWNIRICMEKKSCRFCNLQKWKDFNKTNSFPYIKCVLRLSCVVHGPIYPPSYGSYCKRFSNNTH